ncbi:MAG: glutamate racemase [Clostridia bacterium]|nr:glutamate racemase [Clostridia bacterium]
MDNRPIGVFDSGLGGLTAVKRIINLLPHEDVVYFGDTGRVPYGNRSRETIIRYTKEDIEFLLKYDIKLIIAACGTASSVALDDLKPLFSVPILGVLEAACSTAATTTRNGRIGVIGTSGTINSGKYRELILTLLPTAQVFEKACPLFVSLAENGHFNTDVVRIVAEEYLSPLKEAGVDTLILGCTHYPLLAEAIGSVMGGGVNLIDTGDEAAKFAKRLLDERCMLSDSDKTGTCSFFVSDSIENFSVLGSTFLGRPIELAVHKVSQ